MSENINQNNAANAEMMALAQSLGKTIDELKAMDEATLRLLPPMIQQKIRQLKQDAMAPAAENQERVNAETAEVARQDAGNANADSDPTQVQPVNQQPTNTETASLADGKAGQNAAASRVEDGLQQAKDDEKKDGSLSEINLLREALKVSEARHKTLQGKYNAEGKRQREENETLKAQLAEAIKQRQQTGGQTELDINDENLKALAENGWDAADIERLAKVILKKQSALSPTAKSEVSKTEEPTQQGKQDQQQQEKPANHGDADVMINAHLLSGIGMSLPDLLVSTTATLTTAPVNSPSSK